MHVYMYMYNAHTRLCMHTCMDGCMYIRNDHTIIICVYECMHVRTFVRILLFIPYRPNYQEHHRTAACHVKQIQDIYIPTHTYIHIHVHMCVVCCTYLIDQTTGNSTAQQHITSNRSKMYTYIRIHVHVCVLFYTL